jgi:hypothetical protein
MSIEETRGLLAMLALFAIFMLAVGIRLDRRK